MAIDGACVVTVLRHGAVAGAPFVYRGSLDDPLSELGWRQMEAAVGAGLPAMAGVERGRARSYDAIATSPLRRCREFAERLAQRDEIPLQILPAFRELDFGEWEGLTPEQAAARDPETHRRFSAGAAASPPGGESLDELRRRVRAGWQAWLGTAAGGRRLLVTHAGVMRALLLELLGLPASHIYRIALPEAAQFQVSLLAGQAPVLLALNPGSPFAEATEAASPVAPAPHRLRSSDQPHEAGETPALQVDHG